MTDLFVHMSLLRYREQLDGEQQEEESKECHVHQQCASYVTIHLILLHTRYSYFMHGGFPINTAISTYVTVF